MAGLPAPPWFDQHCTQSLDPGLQLVTIQRSAEDPGEDGQILIDASGLVLIPAERYATWTGRSPSEPAREQDGRRWLPLRGLPNRVDACEARLQIAAEQPATHSRTQSEPLVTPAAVNGAVLNIDLFAQTQGEHETGSALTELGASTAAGYLRQRTLLAAGGPVRLDTQLRHDLTDLGQTVTLGDQTTSNRFGSNVLYGGISWGSDFSQHPEQPTYPLPLASGRAALPSSAELYVDGQLRQHQTLPSGPYLLSAPPTSQGAGTLQIVTRDLQGRETRLSQPFYISPQLLRQGLDDFRIDVGRLRYGLGSRNDSYGDSFGSAEWRRGLRDDLTAGGHIDLSPGRTSLQAELLASDPRWGLSQAGAGLSHDIQAGAGFSASLGQEWRQRDNYMQGSLHYGSPAFVELGKTPGAIAMRASLQGGTRLSEHIQASAAWLHEARRDRPDINLTSLSLQYHESTQRQWSLSSTETGGIGWTHQIGLLQTLSPTQMLFISLQRTPDDRQAYLQWYWQPLRDPWSLRTSYQRNRLGEATAVGAAYNGARGLGSLLSIDDSSGRQLQGSLSTGLAWIPGSLFWTRHLRDSFLIADVGEPDVTVYRNHLAVGRTDSAGRLLISDTLPYQPVQVSVSHEDLPITAQARSLDALVRPRRGGSRLVLSLPRASWSLSWRARLSDGSWLPAGSEIHVQGETEPLPSGLDGLLYLPASRMHQTLDIQLPDRRQCHISALPDPAVTEEVTCATP